MGLNRVKLTIFYNYPSSTHGCSISRVNTSGRTRQTLDDNNQHLPSWEYRAYSDQYSYPLLFWQIPVYIDWREEIPHGLLHRGHAGEYLIHTFRAAFFYSYWCLRSCFCRGRSTGRPKLRVFVFPIPVPLPLWAAVIGGFLIISFFPNVAWQAHLGGLAFGLTIGYFFKKRPRLFF